MKPISVLIADDHAVVRKGLAALIDEEPDLRVAGEARDGDEAVAKALSKHPDVIVMDIMMPVLDGVEATRRILAAWPDAKIVILTSFVTSDMLADGIAAGAKGAVLKSDENDSLMETIRRVQAGKTVIAEEVRQLLKTDPPVKPLSARQREILESITRGLTNKDIAIQLGISPTSVQSHVLTIFEKLGAANKNEAVAIALRKHLLKI